MIKLTEILKEIGEGVQPYPFRLAYNNAPYDSEKQESIKIVPGQILNLYHSSPNSKLDISDTPIHLGTKEQADDRIEILWNDFPKLYLYKVKVELRNPCPEVLQDVDKGVGHETEDFLKYGTYNEYWYVNKGEGDLGDDNLSLFIVDFRKSYIGHTLIEIVRTGS